MGKKDRGVVFGTAEPITGRPYSRLEDRPINRESMLDFLKQPVRYYPKRYPGMPLVMVQDKHPAQSPDLNPIEPLWDWLAKQRIKTRSLKPRCP